MKKTIVAALLLILPLLACAQGRITVTYESPDSIPAVTRELMAFQDINYMKAIVHGDIKGKKWILWANEVNDGKVTSKPLFPYTFDFADTTATFTFIAQLEGKDSVRISCNTPRYGGGKIKYAIDPGKNTRYGIPYILMETFPEKPYVVPGEISLAAYTSGIAKSSTSYDFCGLRFANTDPKLWQEKHKVPRFVYFTLRIED